MPSFSPQRPDRFSSSRWFASRYHVHAIVSVVTSLCCVFSFASSVACWIIVRPFAVERNFVIYVRSLPHEVSFAKYEGMQSDAIVTRYRIFRCLRAIAKGRRIVRYAIASSTADFYAFMRKSKLQKYARFVRYAKMCVQNIENAVVAVKRESYDVRIQACPKMVRTSKRTVIKRIVRHAYLPNIRVS